MATREENLKKINEEMEMLTDDELDQVAGGTVQECIGDKNFLKDMGVYKDNPSQDYRQNVVDAWYNSGVMVNARTNGKDNAYFDAFTGKPISRREAFRSVLKRIKRIDINNCDYEFPANWNLD